MFLLRRKIEPSIFDMVRGAFPSLLLLCGNPFCLIVSRHPVRGIECVYRIVPGGLSFFICLLAIFALDCIFVLAFVFCCVFIVYVLALRVWRLFIALLEVFCVWLYFIAYAWIFRVWLLFMAVTCFFFLVCILLWGFAFVCSAVCGLLLTGRTMLHFIAVIFCRFFIW